MPPLVGVAVNVTEVPAQIAVPGETPKLTEGVKAVPNVIVFISVAVAGDAQLELEVISTFTTSLFAKLSRIKVAPVSAWTVVLIVHLYVGVVPPLVGVAVNVTEVPAQIAVPGETPKLTEGVKAVPNVIVFISVAVAGDAQLELEVISTFTTSLFAKLSRVKVAPVSAWTVVLIVHLYIGVVPPLVGVAVNVTEVPAQMVVPGETPKLTEGVKSGLTNSVTAVVLTGSVQPEEVNKALYMAL